MLHRDRSNLLTGLGRYVGTPEGDAARNLIRARQRHGEAESNAQHATSWRERRHWGREAARCADAKELAEAMFIETVTPEVRRLDEAITHLEAERDELQRLRRERSAWFADHPEGVRRLRTIDRELNPLPDALAAHRGSRLREGALGIGRDAGVERPNQGIELDFGP